jgi:tetratricopeptide (TPR) repeat protein
VTDLSSLDRAAAHALIHSSPALPAFGVELVSALLDRDEDDAALVLGRWVREGIAIENEPGRYAIRESAANVSAERRTAAEVELRLLVLMAVLADLARDPDTPRFSAEYEIPVSSPFASPGEAMLWFESNRPALRDLVDVLFDTSRYRPCAMLAEALLGLCGHGGYLQDQVDIANKALQALGRSRFSGGFHADGADGAARARDRDQAVATINLVLASAWCTWGGVPTALQAIDHAEEHVRKLGGGRLRADVHRCRANVHLAAGNLETAESEALVSLGLADDTQDGMALYLGQWSLGRIRAAQGRHHEARDELDKAADGASKLGHAIPYARVLTDVSASMIASGEPEDAIRVLTTAERALTQADAGSPAYLADVDRNMARAWRAAGDPTRAETYFHQAIGRYRLARRYRLAEDVEAEWAQR